MDGVQTDYADIPSESSHTVQSSEPTSATHDFIGWRSSVDSKIYHKGDSVQVNEDIIFTAQWIRKTYTVTYAAGDPAAAGSLSGLTTRFDGVQSGSAHTIQSAVPTSATHVFTGWRSDVTDDETLYAPGSSIEVNQNIDAYGTVDAAHLYRHV